MKIILLLIFLTGCGGLTSYEDMLDLYIGRNESFIKPTKNYNPKEPRLSNLVYIGVYKNNKNYQEHITKITPVDGSTCQVVFKIRKGNIISWYFKGKKCSVY